MERFINESITHTRTEHTVINKLGHYSALREYLPAGFMERDSQRRVSYINKEKELQLNQIRISKASLCLVEHQICITFDVS